MRIGIIDYKAGNPISILRALKNTGVNAFISSDPEALGQADKLILPGIGAFDEAMIQLKANGITDMLWQKVRTGNTPFLGICLGMQLTTASSEEGREHGLGWLDAYTIRLREDRHKIKVPHTGWNYVDIHKSSKLFTGMNEKLKFYFIHSYHVVCNKHEDILCTTQHESDLVAAIEKDNIACVQFHPEKSGTYGITFLKNFSMHF